jgi:hypothetical protein
VKEQAPSVAATGKDKLAAIAKMWRELPQGERDRRNAAAQQARAAWKAQQPR